MEGRLAILMSYVFSLTFLKQKVQTDAVFICLFCLIAKLMLAEKELKIMV